MTDSTASPLQSIHPAQLPHQSVLLRQLPSVDQLLQLPQSSGLIQDYGHPLTVEALRVSQDNLRVAILNNGIDALPPAAALVEDAQKWLETLLRPTIRRAINATGIIIHTNLGRALLSDAALAAVQHAGGGYATLEYDVEAGRRGSRAAHAEALLTRLTGAEAALVVNNNAAAVLLMLTALCQGQEVIISRGQLVEIGGGFRIPDVMAQSGARLIEVGTTNRTYLHDFDAAISEKTSALLAAHHSNYQIVGFTGEPTLGALAGLAHEHDLLMLYDQGSGALLDVTPYGLEHEPTVQEGIAAGCDVVAFSGDKLLGGPQAGILCGRSELIARLKRHPLARAVRADKLCLAGLAATLTHYLRGEATTEIPVWRMISKALEDIESQAQQWATFLSERGLALSIVDEESCVGGGSVPGSSLPTRVLAIEHSSVDRLAAALRGAAVPVAGRIHDQRLLLDPRTVLPGEEEMLLATLIACYQVP
jgi:L-seryl-tRNA(Ser) seleniumtransferase